MISGTLIPAPIKLPNLGKKKYKIDLIESSPYSVDCQIQAKNDLEAVAIWLHEYRHSKNTVKSYKREAIRFLMWCAYNQGKTLGFLKKEDIEDYLNFMQSPPSEWCESKEKEWRPFSGKLTSSGFTTSVKVLSSMFNYLVQADYLRANPIKLIKKYSKLSLDYEKHKYKVWERVLEQDEWDAIQNALEAMPEDTDFEIDNKMRTQFLFAILYLLGLRINELVGAKWSDFNKKNDQWWFFVEGKGGKPGHIPVNEQLLNYIKSYRIYLGKEQYPESSDHDNLIVSKKTKKPLSSTQLYILIKVIGNKAAESFSDDIGKRDKLRKLSPHWLRHLAATHQDKIGMPATMIKNNLRHQSVQTTHIYMHSEDNLRYEAMQDMQMQIKPKVIDKHKELIGYEYRIKLSKGPVDKVSGIDRLMSNIEELIFSELSWQRVGDDKGELLDKVNKSTFSEISLIYHVKSQDIVDRPEVWSNAIKRQAEIWMFKCEIKLTGIVN